MAYPIRRVTMPDTPSGFKGFTITVIVDTEDIELAHYIRDELRSFTEDLRAAGQRIAHRVKVGEPHKFMVP